MLKDNPRITTGMLLLAASMIALLLCPPRAMSQDREYVIDKSDPGCSNKGPGNEGKPWCNLWALHSRKFNPGSTVSIKAGEYFGNEDPEQSYPYHDGINIYAGGTANQPFTLRAWPGDEGAVRIYSGKRDQTYAYVFWGGHLRVKGLEFVGHVELADSLGRLYSPRMFRFAIADGPVSDVRFDSVRITSFQGADDDGLGCRFLDFVPIGQCDPLRSAEGWGRGIDVGGVSDFAFEHGEISCTDEKGRLGLPEIRESGLYVAADGIKSGSECSNITIRDNVFGDCGHNNLMFTRCDSVLVERNFFKNELHRSASFANGTGNTVRYNTFAAWEKMRVELRDGGGNALQFRTSNSKVHHNVFYGGGEPNHQGAINFAALDSFSVSGNEIFNNVALASNSLSFNLNDKVAEPFNMRDNRIYNNIFIGDSTENGVMRWESATRDAYLEGETFGNEVRNNIFYSLTGDPEIVSFSGPRRTERHFSEEEFNDLQFASGNMFADPGLADLNYEDPDFHIQSSCVALHAGLPIDVERDFEGKLLDDDGERPSLGPYVAAIERVDMPIPLSPQDGTEGYPPYAAFVWRKVNAGEAYHFQLARDTTFSEPMLDSTLLASNRYLMTEPLPYDSTFYWRVRVSVARGDTLPAAADCTPWSPIQRFRIAIGTAAEEIPPEYVFSLAASYPNPFTRSTTIHYSVPETVPVDLTVYDALGRTVETLVDRTVSRGEYSVTWSFPDVAAGIYFYRIAAGDFEATRSVLLTR